MRTQRRGVRSGIGAVTLVWVLFAGAALPAQAQEGHAVQENRVLVNRASHWRAWQGSSSLIEVSDVDNSMRPLLQRKDTNAALDAPQFAATGQGGVTVASGQATASRVIDGDTTSWGPDPRSPLKDWWLELNLGRLVVVRKIIVRFAEEGFGDPFLQFKVLGWRAAPPSGPTRQYTLIGTDIPKFWEIGRTNRPNKTQRVFEFVPYPTELADPEFVGDALERIQIIAFGSDSTKAKLVSEAEHAALPASQRGGVEYFRSERSGRRTQILQSEYEQIDPARRDTILYYRREMPRIAEIEVVTAGDNLNLGLVERRGTAFVDTQKDPRDITLTVADGQYSKGHTGSIFGYKTYNYVEDLGGLFWIDTMYFLTHGPSGTRDFAVDVSDGSLAPDGTYLWERVADSRSLSGLRYREIRIEPSRVRLLRTPFGNLNATGGLSYIGFTEVMLSGGGYVAEVTMKSDLIKLDDPKNLISIEWDADTPSGTQLQLQTRTGNELAVDTLYYDSRGNPKTASEFNRLPPSRKGEIKFESNPGADWSTFSVPYARSGQEITSPSPRQYMEMRVTLLTARADTAATLRSIQLNMSDPVAERLLGEVYPLRVGTTGSAEEFSYFIRPILAGASQGIDEVMIQATAGTEMELLGVRHGTDSDFENGTATEVAAAQLTVVETAADTLQFMLPQRLDRGTDLIEVRYRASIFGNSGSFRGFARDNTDSEFWQRIDTGDATELVSSSSVTVLALAGSEVISGLTTSTDVVTPNGDGINEQIVFSFTVARLGSQTPVRLRIYDLSGRMVREIEELRADPRGAYGIPWDGTDGQGPVPPGVYLARIEVSVDSDAAGRSSLQRVVYVAY